jgi:hypothetical protein
VAACPLLFLFETIDMSQPVAVGHGVPVRASPILHETARLALLANGFKTARVTAFASSMGLGLNFAFASAKGITGCRVVDGTGGADV